jgi:hypothetical protein
LDEPLAIDNSASIEFGDPRNGSRGLGGIEVDYFWGGAFEWEDDGVGWEDSEVGVKFLWIVSGCIWKNE